jgi:tetratricopeptide (TPR) repeat protein
LGVVLSRQGRTEDAEAAYSEALELDPELLPALQHLARVYVLSGREELALGLLRRAANQGDLERDLALKLALAELSRGELTVAEGQLESLGTRFDSVRALLLLGQIRSKQGNLAGALEALSAAQRLAPNSEEVLAAVSRAGLATDNSVMTLVALEPLTRMYPTVPEYHYLMGLVRLRVGDSAGAIEALQVARGLQPGRAVILVALGLAMNEQTRYSEATLVLRDALNLEPDQVQALAALAEAEEGQAQLEEAERHAERALALEPSHPTATLVLGMVRLKQARFEEARDLLKRAVDSDPGSPKAHYQLNLAYARLGDLENSRRQIELYREALRKLDQSKMDLENPGNRPGETP